MPASRTSRRVVGRLATAVCAIVSMLTITANAPSVSAAAGDCGFTGPTQTFLASNGAWNVAANWDTNTIPAGGQICIPSGRIATLGDYQSLVGSFYSQTLRIYGTLRITGAPNGAGTSVYGSSTVHNWGTIEVTAGSKFTIGNYDSFVYNHPGAVIGVAPTGTLIVTRDLHNIGGQINLNGTGAMGLYGAAAVFEQGAESSTQGTVVNGTVNVSGGLVDLTGGGAASVRFFTNGTLQGVVSAAQTVSYTCDTFSSSMNIAGNVTNNGTINFSPRVGGACSTTLGIPTGLTLTNNGVINAGTADAYLNGAGTFINGTSGVVNVDESFVTTISNFTTRGSLVVDAGKQFSVGDSLFVLESGTITNNGTIRVDRSSASYGYFAVVRVENTALTGNPISLYASHVELPGAGAVAFRVLKDGYADLRSTSGPTVIHPNQSFFVEGTLASAYPSTAATEVINQGTITLTGIAASAGSTLGTGGTASITNQGSIVLTASESAAGPYNYIAQPLVNEVGGVVRNIGSGRGCYIQAKFTNRGLFQLDPGQNCIVAYPHFASTSVFRTSASGTSAGQMVGIQNDSALGGTVDVVTVSPVPALGQELPIATPASGRKVGGNFGGITGSILSTLGYGFSYDEPNGHQIKLKVVAGSFSSGSHYTPLVPARLLETRSGPGLSTVDGQAYGGGAVAAGSVTELQVTGRANIPGNAAAAVLNITVTGAQGPGFLTVFPCGSQKPNAASLNYETGSTIPNAVIATIGAGGKVCIYTLAGTDLIADVNGYYPPGSGYSPLVPARLLETRSGQGLGTVDGQAYGGGAAAAGSVTELKVVDRAGIPVDASAVALNVTVTGAQGPGFVTVFPCGSQKPNAASLNYETGSTIPNAVIAKVGAGGKVCLYTLATTDLIVDVNGYYPAGSSYTPLVPARLLETRTGPGLGTVDGQSNGGGAVAAGSVTELKVVDRHGIPANAGAVVLNVTVTGAQGGGFVTVFPCGSTKPNAANLNYVLGSTIPNAVIAKVGAGGKVCLFTLAGTDLIADVNGWFPSVA